MCLNRGFSADDFHFINPGALLQAGDETAPLVLDTFYAFPAAAGGNAMCQLSQRLVEILDQIIRVFEPDGQTQQTFR